MNPRIIEVTVSAKGEITLQTKGFAGSDCLRASRFLEQALGVAIQEQKTAEFHQPVATEQEVHQ